MPGGECSKHGRWDTQKSCPTCNREHYRAWAAKPGNLERSKQQQAEYYEANRDRLLANERANSVARRQRIKREMMDHYGGKCACCGVADLVFLTLDHINDDGAAHRRETIGSDGYKRFAGEHTYRWIRANDFPPIFQVLCWNCNYAKSRPGGCPHLSNPQATC